MKLPDFAPFSRLPKRLRNTLFSLLFCTGLIVAYYATTGNQPLPADTHITYESAGQFRVDLDAEGRVRVASLNGTITYKMSKFAVRRVLRAFQQVDFFGQDIRAYERTGRTTCQLTLVENYQKAVIRHACGTQAAVLAKPIQVLEHVTRFRAVLKGDESAIRDLDVAVSH